MSSPPDVCASDIRSLSTSSSPESQVEIELMTGPNGKATEIHNLPSGLTHHTQYKALVNTHDGADQQFSYSGTNGFTARHEKSGTD